MSDLIYVPEIGYMKQNEAYDRVVAYIKANKLSYEIKECLLSLCYNLNDVIDYAEKNEELEDEIKYLKDEIKDLKDEIEDLKK